VLRFTRAVAESFEVERPEMTDVEALRERWGPDRTLLERAVELGLLRPVGEGRFEERSPRLSAAARELARLGVAPERVLDVAEQIRHGADGIAGAFVQLFLDEVWRPFVEAGQPAERWPEVFESLERLRPLAAESLLGIFQIAMTERVERELGDQIGRLAAEARGAA